MARRLVPALLAFALIVGVVLVAGLSGDDSDSGSSNQDLTKKPVIEVPDGDPPKTLESTDLVEGDGATAEPGSAVSVQYVGVDYETGKEFDTSWGREPFQFQLGSGSVIPGWDQGVVGMKVGGRRQLVIPPDLAYGAQGSPPDIGPNATLIFVIDLLDVQAPAKPAG
jgi:peptidylprolyl isomerase